MYAQVAAARFGLDLRRNQGHSGWRAGGAAGRIRCPPGRRAHASPRLQADRRRPGELRRLGTGPVRRPGWCRPGSGRRAGGAAQPPGPLPRLRPHKRWPARRGCGEREAAQWLDRIHAPGTVGEHDIWVVQPDGTGLRRVTQSPQTGLTTTQPGRRTARHFCSSGANSTQPQRVAMKRSMRATHGGDFRQITHCRGDCWSDGEAAWSPGGDRIAFSRAIVRAPRRGHGSRSTSRTATAAWLMRSTPPAPRPSRACAPMATPGRDWLPARHRPPGRSATLGITSRAQPCHTTTTGGKSRSPRTLLSLDLCVYVRPSRAAGRDTANRAV